MSSKKWIFSMLIGSISLAAMASTTKVGNGDDGSDLEGTTKITSGIILQTRQEAIDALKKLNLDGIAGLSQVIPELEHSELLMAKSDVHPLNSETNMEVSGDQHTVYARTFAEPHAPTRFFPAALTLSKDQLISLHTHEALHRALPVNVREDENKVAYLTMAMTSPSASNDRVRLVAQSILSPETTPALARSTVQTNESSKPEIAPSKTEIAVGYTASSSYDNLAHVRNIETLGVRFSPMGVRKLWNMPFEPQVSLSAMLDQYPSYPGAHIGPGSVNVTLPFWIDNGESAGPIFQYNSQVLKSQYPIDVDREVETLGAFFENHGPRFYDFLKATYTLPSSYAHPGEMWDPSTNQIVTGVVTVPAILTLAAHEGYKLGKFTLGAFLEYDHVAAYQNLYVEMTGDLTILRAGPELTWTNGSTRVSAVIGMMLNSPQGDLDYLADPAGHGTGRSSASLSIGQFF